MLFSLELPKFGQDMKWRKIWKTAWILVKLIKAEPT